MVLPRIHLNVPTKVSACLLVYIVIYTMFYIRSKVLSPMVSNMYIEPPYVDISLTGVDTISGVTIGYSNFTYRKPYFIDEHSRQLFYKRDLNKYILNNVQTSKTFFGDVYIVKNGRFDNYNNCGRKGGKNWIKTVGYVKKENWFKILLPLTMEDSGTFQHFQDRVLLRLLQVLPTVRSHNVTILLQSPRDQILYDFFDRWHIRSQMEFYKKGEIYGADFMIHSCIFDSYHPLLWQESRRITGIQTKRQVPIKAAFIILLTRDGCFNCGRQILNHNETVSMLKARYGKDFVKVFKGPKPLNYSLDLFNKARIILGAHGGGFYNIIYAPENTAVVEFMPTLEDGTTGILLEDVFLRIASILNQDYWRVASPPKFNDNIIIDISLLEKLLNEVDKMQLHTS